MAESVAAATDPLNLMRVMPPKEARFSAMRFRAWLFYAVILNEVKASQTIPRLP